jgi:hypothetical protein
MRAPGAFTAQTEIAELPTAGFGPPRSGLARQLEGGNETLWFVLQSHFAALCFQNTIHEK